MDTDLYLHIAESTHTDEPQGTCGDGGKTHWDACPCRQRAHAAALEYQEIVIAAGVEMIASLRQEVHEKDGLVFEQNLALQSQAGHIDDLNKEIASLRACVERRNATIEAMQESIVRMDGVNQMGVEMLGGVKRWVKMQEKTA